MPAPKAVLLDVGGVFLVPEHERIVAVRELLRPEGCVIVHVDPRTSHYVKVLCDEVFGEEAFASEIVWRYTEDG